MRRISFPFSIKRWSACAALVALAWSFSAYASSPVSKPALVRSGEMLVQKQVPLENLISDRSFDGQYFKVVDGESDDAVPFNCAPDLRLKAATVYYTFTQSRNYFVRILEKQLQQLPPDQRDFLNAKMVIRLDMTHPYSAAVHFDRKSTIANGAVTVPASDVFRDDSLKEWGPETWFFVGKEEVVPNPASGIANVIGNSQFKLSVFESLAQQDAASALQAWGNGSFSATVLAENLAVSLGLSQLFPTVLAGSIHLIPAKVYLDAAMVPEIAANEYAHYALAPWLGLKRRFHVGEGYAHYFAAKITGLTRLQDGAGKYSKGYDSIRGDSAEMYSFINEVGAFGAMSSFTFSVLEDLEREFGPKGLPVILGTLPYLSPESNLKFDFTRAVFGSVSKLKGVTFEDTIRAHSVLLKRGF